MAFFMLKGKIFVFDSHAIACKEAIARKINVKFVRYVSLLAT